MSAGHRRELLHLYPPAPSGRLHRGCIFGFVIVAFHGKWFLVNLRLFSLFTLTEGRPPGQRPSLSHAAFRQKKFFWPKPKLVSSRKPQEALSCSAWLLSSWLWTLSFTARWVIHWYAQTELLPVWSALPSPSNCGGLARLCHSLSQATSSISLLLTCRGHPWKYKLPGSERLLTNFGVFLTVMTHVVWAPSGPRALHHHSGAYGCPCYLVWPQRDGQSHTLLETSTAWIKISSAPWACNTSMIPLGVAGKSMQYELIPQNHCPLFKKWLNVWLCSLLCIWQGSCYAPGGPDTWYQKAVWWGYCAFAMLPLLDTIYLVGAAPLIVLIQCDQGRRKKDPAVAWPVLQHNLGRPPKKRSHQLLAPAFVTGLVVHWAPELLLQLQRKEDSCRAEKKTWMDQ